MKNNDADTAISCLSRLATWRADDYDAWLSVGMALHASGAPLSAWEAWSKQSDKWREGACEKKWNSFHLGENALTIASLIQWVKEDGNDVPRNESRPHWQGETEALDWESEIFIGDPREVLPEYTPGVDKIIKYYKALFQDDEFVNIVTKSFTPKHRDGKFVPAGKGHSVNRDKIINDILAHPDDLSYAYTSWNPKAGAWVRINPVDGNGVKDVNITDYRHVLVECDSLSTVEQWAIVRRLNLPCAAIVSSGKKSVHAIVKIEAGTDYKLYRKRVLFLFSELAKENFPVDKSCKNPSRLSRLPGVDRDGQIQYVMAVNVGAKSWEDWEIDRKENTVEFDLATPTQLENIDPEDRSDSLLGNRFLTRGSQWLVVAQSGIGKSVFAIQAAMNFAAGREMLGIVPERPLVNLIIQAENNLLDLVQPYHSILKYSDFQSEEYRNLSKNLFILSDTSHSGQSFGTYLKAACKRFKPDIVWMDPLMAYIGDDISKQAVCAKFLRNLINPIIEEYHAGLVVMHHTGKPPKNQEKQYQGGDLAYLGIGSSDLTNWARAISTILEDQNTDSGYVLTHVKRSGRAGTGKEISIRHAEEGEIYWTENDYWTPDSSKIRSKYAGMGIENMDGLDLKGGKKENPVYQFVGECLENNGLENTFKSQKRAFDSVRKNKIPIVLFDSKLTKLWYGIDTIKGKELYKKKRHV